MSRFTEHINSPPSIRTAGGCTHLQSKPTSQMGDGPISLAPLPNTSQLSGRPLLEILPSQASPRKGRPTTRCGATASFEPLSFPTKLIFAQSLSEVANALVMWRLKTFYYHFMPNKSRPVIPASIRSIIDLYDWEGIWTILQAEHKRQKTCIIRGLLTFTIARQLYGKSSCMDAVHAGSKSTGLPERQIIAAVEAYAHFRRKENRSSGKFLNCVYFTERKEFEVLARTILADKEDLAKCVVAFQTLYSVSDNNWTEQSTAIGLAITACTNRYFSNLEWNERRYCYRSLGRRKSERRMVYGLREKEKDGLEGDKELIAVMRAVERVKLRNDPVYLQEKPEQKTAGQKEKDSVKRRRMSIMDEYEESDKS